MSETDVRWEDGLCGAVVQIVAHVGEEGALRFKLLDEADGFFEVRVAGVRVVTERVEDEDVEVLQQREADGRDVAESVR